MDLLLVRHALPERVEGADGPADPVLTDEGRDIAAMGGLPQALGEAAQA